MPRIGLISDTHGLLRPQALAFLRGCDHILHAGDVCDAAVLQGLGELAPVTAVRGNNDFGPWAQALPDTQLVQFDEVRIHLLHDLAKLAIEPHAVGVRVVVFGHSHKPGVSQRDGVLYVNPGSAGPRRFKLPIAVGELIIAGRSVTPRIVELQ